MPPQNGPLLIAEDEERNSPARQILLVTNVLVSGDQEIKPCRLGGGYQFAVNQSIPSSFDRFNHGVAFEHMSKGCRGAVIEEDEHRPAARAAEQEERPNCEPRIR
jgi:hypothetical protein